MGHQAQLSDHRLTVGVAPNVDTLYSLAWLDLDAGDFYLETPDFGPRYYSFQICESDTRTAAVFGQRTEGAHAPAVHIRRAGGGERSAPGYTTVTCDSRYVMIVGRILVEPTVSDDTDLVRELQNQIILRGPACDSCTTEADSPDLVVLDRNAEIFDPTGFIKSLENVLKDMNLDDLPGDIRHAVELLGMHGTPVSLTEDETAAVSAGLRDGFNMIEHHVRSLGRVANGWAINDNGSEFGSDYLLRATVAHAQIFVNPSTEAIYPVCELDSEGEELDGRSNRYQLVFDRDNLPPADAFWSVTMYHKHGLLVDNALGRYAIGDRTTSIKHGGGSTVIRIQSSEPDEGPDNWLPAPPGPFRLMLRLYSPREGRWVPPAVTRL
ncbi:DUF1214 domain-containing protein [Rhodococcus sp. WB9]|uniref:DUF1214 domain-containing protein n=1 Tax=Rhodococcus sp. WB9 TaxID=2594007 RepID=UPI001642954D|nr:DUF1214 domain-containing protein [Rhodococcus sp. WB9]